MRKTNPKPGKKTAVSAQEGKKSTEGKGKDWRDILRPVLHHKELGGN